MNSRLDLLESLLGKLPAKDLNFAKDLIRKGRKYGASEGQMKWVNILIDRASGVEPAKEPNLKLGDYSGVYKLFEVAKKANKFPKLRLKVGEHPVVLSVAGERSKQPGVINVTDGGPFGNNKWYGRVMPDGEWVACRNDYPELMQVALLLKRLGEEPEAVAAEYGKMNGYCCFCGKALSDDKSVAVGYGEQCAKNWGLSAQYKASKGFKKLVAEAA
jgi:hypothetical protein